MLLGAGAPQNGAVFSSRFDVVSRDAGGGEVVTRAGSHWIVLSTDFHDPEGVLVLLAVQQGSGWAKVSLPELRARFLSGDS